MYHATEDNSVVDDQGRVIVFSPERFARDIWDGDCCFICGRARSQLDFNDEHVLPEWILRRYNLFSKAITLPNGTHFRYDQYKIPCCVECNDLMGREIEKPVSELIHGGYDALRNDLKVNGFLRFFVWMGLIFLKTHLKDRNLRLNRDLRQPSTPISSLYTSDHLHHIHSVVRCFYTGSRVAADVLGSFLVLLARNDMGGEAFDFGDLYFAQSMILRVDDIAILAVFNDSGRAANSMTGTLKRINGPLSEVQLRELMSDLAFRNMITKEHPTYSSLLDLDAGLHHIEAEIPTTLEMIEPDLELRGALMLQALHDMLKSIRVPGFTPEQLESVIKSGRWSFLFDGHGNFVSAPTTN